MRKKLALCGAIAGLLVFVQAACFAGTPSPTAKASVARQAIVVAGKPFFPVMLLDQCAPQGAVRARALGANVILNADCPAVLARRQLSSLTSGQLGVLSIRGRDVRGSRLLGWAYPDEPDNNGWTPGGLAARFRYRSGNPDGLISFLTLTSSFYTGPDRAARSAQARDFARVADVAGFDLYPLNHCRTDLTEVYDAQRQFVRLAAGKPTFQWIETGAIHPDYCGSFKMTPAQLSAEAWLAVAGGARGIGFFTHTWSPAHAELDVSPPIAAAITRFAGLAKAIAPGLTGRTALSGVNTPALKVLARSAGATTYVVAVNTVTSVVPAIVAVPRLGNGSLTVVGEHRQVTVRDGRFADTFAPLGVHVYATS